MASESSDMIPSDADVVFPHGNNVAANAVAITQTVAEDSPPTTPAQPNPPNNNASGVGHFSVEFAYKKTPPPQGNNENQFTVARNKETPGSDPYHSVRGTIVTN